MQMSGANRYQWRLPPAKRQRATQLLQQLDPQPQAAVVSASEPPFFPDDIDAYFRGRPTQLPRHAGAAAEIERTTTTNIHSANLEMVAKVEQTKSEPLLWSPRKAQQRAADVFGLPATPERRNNSPVGEFSRGVAAAAAADRQRTPSPTAKRQPNGCGGGGRSDTVVSSGAPVAVDGLLQLRPSGAKRHSSWLWQQGS
eukprot:gnl/TRDRNA2_/TRDRNA2_138329_c0_seq1.p1 gnl/TRDRNA2_/TRDRNA2_138329_c0~~gnl/TRDRNA2_/TRDRNA2_138329_c0_seq1.p1  ORF type:complete len:198 (-),score=36.54 gnl/TRDRNA2_/TRDRNA2_138329_c0_seq1:72-665(-)